MHRKNHKPYSSINVKWQQCLSIHPQRGWLSRLHIFSLTTLQKQRCMSQQNHAKPIKNRQEVLSAKGCAFLVVAAGDNWLEALSAAQSSLKDTITKWVLPRGSRIEGVKDVNSINIWNLIIIMNPWKTPKNRGNSPKLTHLSGKFRERGENSDSPGNLKASWIYISLLLPSLSSKTRNIFSQSKVIVSRDAWNPSCVKPFMCETPYAWKPSWESSFWFSFRTQECKH